MLILLRSFVAEGATDLCAFGEEDVFAAVRLLFFGLERPVSRRLGKNGSFQVHPMTGLTPGRIMLKEFLMFFVPQAVINRMDAMRAIESEAQAAIGMACRTFTNGP